MYHIDLKTNWALHVYAIRGRGYWLLPFRNGTPPSDLPGDLATKYVAARGGWN
jgi:hypothetical protein